MDRHGKAKYGRLHAGDFRPRGRGVRGFENSIVVLDPHDVGIRPALHETVDVLQDRLELLFRWRVFGAHAPAADFPGLPGISRDPDAAGRNADADVARVAWVNADGMNARMLRAVQAPVLALRMIPQRPVQLP